jgi:5-dehydro-2-deoxygluconokinase
MGPEIVIEKVGREGCRVHKAGGAVIEAPGYPVEIMNILGAGDAFGAGFIYGYVRNWGLLKAARFANACGAIVVTRPGCSNAMPTFDEVMDFVDGRGGL